jgi:hypothetical protein
VARKLRPGQYLPPIPQLVKTWGLGYSTIHNAMGILEKEGLINCKTDWGKGPVITSHKKKVYNVLFVRWGNFTQFIAIEDGIRNYYSQFGTDFEINIVDSDEDMSQCVDSMKHAPGHADGIILYPWKNPEFISAASALIQNGMNVIGVGVFWQKITFGIIILVALVITTDRKRRNLVVK